MNERRDRKYLRVYYNDLSRDYPDIWQNDAALATYVRLLAVMEPMWPMVPEIPRSARAAALRALTEAGLIAASGKHGFSIRGYDVDRSARSNRASNAAGIRWGDATGNAPSTPTSTANEMPSTSTSTSTKIPPPPAKRGRRKNGTNPRAKGTAPRQNGHAPRQEGTSPRQEREALKRGGGETLAAILRRSAELGHA